MSWIAVALGGALGATLRFGAVGFAARLTGPAFPYGTMAVNVVGSFLIGLLAIFLAGRDPALKLFAITGILGGFTTFSAFSLETVALLEEGRFGAALVYALGSVMLCVLAAFAGILTARSFA